MREPGLYVPGLASHWDRLPQEKDMTKAIEKKKADVWELFAKCTLSTRRNESFA